MDAKPHVKRAQVSLKIKFKSETLEAFTERYAVDVSQGGIFIRTKEPQPVGTSMKFEFQLKDTTPLIAGEGTVVWTRENDPTRPNAAPGMGVRFDRLNDGSQEILEKILAAKSKQAGSRAHSAETKPPEFNEVPTRVAPSPLMNQLSTESSGKQRQAGAGAPPPSDDMTPLPPPMPFATEAGSFASTAFSDATKVRSFDDLVGQPGLDLGMAARPSAKPAPASQHDDFGAQATRVQTLDELAKETSKPAAATAHAGSSGDFGAQATRVQTLDELMNEASKSDASKPGNNELSAAIGELASKRDADAKATEQAATDAKAKAAREARDPDDKAAAVVATSQVDAKADTVRAPRLLDTSPAAKEQSRDVARTTASAAVAMAAPAATPEGSSGSGGKIVGLLVVAAIAAAAVWFFVIRDKGTAADSSATPIVATGSGSAGSGSAMVATGSAVGSGGAMAGSAVAPVAPPAELVDTKIAVATSNATVMVEGGASAAAPVVAKLERGKTYQVTIAAPGFVTQQVAVVGGTPPESIKLLAKTRMIHLESTPAGAQIYLNGRITPQVTPADVEMVGTLAKLSSVRVALRLAGYADVAKNMAKDVFIEQPDAMVATLKLSLEVKKADKPKVVDPTPDTGSGSGTTTTTPITPPTTIPPTTTPPTTTPPTTTDKPPSTTVKPAPATVKPPATTAKPPEPTPAWANP